MNEDKNPLPPADTPYVAQPTGQAAEQQPIAQNFTMHIVEPTVSKPSKWRPLFKAIGIVQAIALVLYVIFMNQTVLLAMGNIAGLGVGLMLLTLAPIVVILALINLIGLPIYLYQHKIKGTGLALGVVSLAISIFFIVSGARVAYASIMFNTGNIVSLAWHDGEYEPLR